MSTKIKNIVLASLLAPVAACAGFEKTIFTPSGLAAAFGGATVAGYGAQFAGLPKDQIAKLSIAGGFFGLTTACGGLKTGSTMNGAMFGTTVGFAAATLTGNKDKVTSWMATGGFVGGIYGYYLGSGINARLTEIEERLKKTATQEQVAGVQTAVNAVQTTLDGHGQQLVTLVSGQQEIKEGLKLLVTTEAFNNSAHQLNTRLEAIENNTNNIPEQVEQGIRQFLVNQQQLSSSKGLGSIVTRFDIMKRPHN